MNPTINWADKGLQAVLVLVAVAVAGLAGLGIAWDGVAATLFPSLQMPFIVSGGFGGIAIVGTALSLLAVHLERRSSASDRAQLETIIGAAAAVADELPGALRRQA